MLSCRQKHQLSTLRHFLLPFAAVYFSAQRLAFTATWRGAWSAFLSGSCGAENVFIGVKWKCHTAVSYRNLCIYMYMYNCGLYICSWKCSLHRRDFGSDGSGLIGIRSLCLYICLCVHAGNGQCQWLPKLFCFPCRSSTKSHAWSTSAHHSNAAAAATAAADALLMLMSLEFCMRRPKYDDNKLLAMNW